VGLHSTLEETQSQGPPRARLIQLAMALGPRALPEASLAEVIATRAGQVGKRQGSEGGGKVPRGQQIYRAAKRQEQPEVGPESMCTCEKVGSVKG
jgi:hypothetical protein